MLNGHGGNVMETARRIGCDPSEIIDMSSNLNPLGPLPGLLDYLKNRIDVITTLPEVDAATVVAQFAAANGLDPQNVLAANGTTQFIYALPAAFAIKQAVIVGPTYADYADACRMHHVRHTYLISDASRDFHPDMSRLDGKSAASDLVFVCNPNNPTGTLIPADELAGLCRRHPDTVFVVDESYLPFVPDSRRQSLTGLELPNLCVLFSSSKIFKIPGLRIGFVIASRALIKKIRRYLLPWSVNSLAQLAIDYLIRHQDEVSAFVQRTRSFCAAERKRFYDAFKQVSDMRLFPSTTPYILIRLPENLKAEDLCGHLAAERLLIRNCANFVGLDQGFIRISLKDAEKNSLLAQRLLQAVDHSIAPEQIGRIHRAVG
jgi:threonine-phosphate decarboxylase